MLSAIRARLNQDPLLCIASRFKQHLAQLKLNIAALALAAQDKRTPLLAKINIGLVVGYALSPIDLIPDFIPVLGYLDDIILLPLGLTLAVRLIPAQVWRECQERASAGIGTLPRSTLAAGVIICIWLLSALAVIVYLLPVS